MSFFFFKQKTAYEIYQCDWSSDVCSSDLWRATSHSISPVAATAGAEPAGFAVVSAAIAAGFHAALVPIHTAAHNPPGPPPE